MEFSPRQLGERYDTESKWVTKQKSLKPFTRKCQRKGTKGKEFAQMWKAVGISNFDDLQLTRP